MRISDWSSDVCSSDLDWLAVERIDGREYDIGIHRRWLDPTRPLAETVLKPAHGVIVTSATLRNAEGWDAAEARTGGCHLDHHAHHFSAAGPFDYAANTEVLKNGGEAGRESGGQY